MTAVHLFQTTIELGGRSATGFEVPPEVLEALGRGKRPPVRVTIAGHTYRSTVGSHNGRPMVPLSAENREAAGVQAGDSVEVGLALDTTPRTVELPDDLAAALDARPQARAAFDALSYSGRRAHVLSVEAARQPETRARRVDKVLDQLSG